MEETMGTTVNRIKDVATLATALNQLGAKPLILSNKECISLERKIETLAKKDPYKAALVILRLESLIDKGKLNIDKMTPMGYGDFQAMFKDACAALRKSLKPDELALLPETSMIPK
jgi:hypothetical protein